MSCDFSDCNMNKSGFHISSRNRFFYETSFYAFSVICILYEVRDIKTLFYFSQSFVPSVFFPVLIFCKMFLSNLRLPKSYLWQLQTEQAHFTAIQFLLLQISGLYFPSSQNLKNFVDSVPLHPRSSHKYLLLRIPFLLDMTRHQWVLDPEFFEAIECPQL